MAGRCAGPRDLGLRLAPYTRAYAHQPAPGDAPWPCDNHGLFTISHATPRRQAKGSARSLLFLKKKKQKDFANLRRSPRRPSVPRQMSKSFFLFFKKEESSLLCKTRQTEPSRDGNQSG
jgi:hypothetical protein